MDDGVVIINCVPLFRRLGVVWPECNSAWFVKDICGIVCVVITWMLIGYAEFVVAFVILLPTSNKIMSIIDGLIFTSLAFLCLASHTRAMLTDPGSVEKGTASKENIQKLRLAAGETLYKCPKCVSIKPERAHHCRRFASIL